MERLAKGGHDYAERFADWESVIDRYESVLKLHDRVRPLKKKEGYRKLKEIHQMTPGFDSGDAITNQTILLRDHLRRLGYISDIHVIYRDEKLADQATLFETNRLSKDAGLIYHHSIGSELTQHAVEHPAPKCLVYHNITPAEFLQPYNPAFAQLLENGRADLNGLANFFPLAVGDSVFNATELNERGFQNPGVLPICIDPSKWDHIPDRDVMAELQDGKANLLFVGRVSPNKCQDHLVESFYHYLTMDPNARLVIVGQVLPNDAYFDKVASTIHRLGLTDSVIITDRVTESQLHAYYRTAHLYWSMSEHEGFGVPLIEAMWFDIPVLAYAVTAVPETMDGAGILFASKDDLVSIAAMAKLCVRDEDLRRKILRAQRKRRTAFVPDKVFTKLEDVVSKMEEIL
jgi:glycosyltransferase involved in cell wall biosynthesis